MLVPIPKSPIASRSGAPPGTWWFTHGVNKVMCVSIKCPICRATSSLRDADSEPLRADGTRGHDIAADGAVSPSILCPTAGCWHIFGRLDDWKGGPT